MSTLSEILVASNEVNALLSELYKVELLFMSKPSYIQYISYY